MREPVGDGGSARVWRGVYGPTGADVAVKFLRPEAFARTGREQFVLEVQTSARLAHPAIVSVFEYGTLEADIAPEDELVEGIPYLVMEYSSRGELRVEQVGSWEALQRVLLQVLDALAYAHARSVVHRDIKPANILRFVEGGEPRLKLSDFGIAQALEPETTRLDRSRLTSSAGTPHYMPPEQLMGKWRTFGPWTDLYALGCTAWELACGAPPFTGRNVAQMAIAHIQSPLPEFQARFAVPSGFPGWLQTMMAKEPRRRFACAADAASALVALGGVGVDPVLDRGTDPARVIEHDADTLVASTVQLNTLPAITPVPSLATPAPAPPHTEQGSVAAGELGADAGAKLPPGLSSIPASDEWRRAAGRASTRGDVRAVGLSLFSLRETPLVGRDEACERIWGELRRVHEDRRVHGLLVRGDAGTGKTRLIQEMARRAEELGAATVFRATHSRLGGPTDGPGRMLERYFVAWELDHDARTERVMEVLRQQAPGEDEAFLREEASVLTQIMGSSPDARVEDGVISRDARYAAMCRLVERAARRGPVILWLDDLQWSTESLEWLEFLRREFRGLPVLVLGTVLEDFSDSPIGTRERIDALSSVEDWEEIDLERLGGDEHRALIESLLGFEPGVAQRLTRCTNGEPLFAFQLVSDLVDAECLQAGPNGYELGDGYELPESMDELWRGRLERVLGTGHDAGDVWKSLELAAVLGTRVVEEEWHAVCEYAEIDASRPLLERLGRAGMVELSEDGWVFVHQTLTLTLQSAADDAGRLSEHHRICAEVLADLYPDADRWELSRIAEHAFEGGAAEQAQSMLLEAAEALVFSHELQEAERLLDLRSRALDALETAPDSRERLVNELLGAQVDRMVGRKDGAVDRLERIIERAEAKGWDAELVEALRETGELHAHDGRVEQALRCYERGLDKADDLGVRGGLARLLTSQGWAFKTLGRFEEAHAVLERARQIYAEEGDEVSEVGVLNPIGFTWLAEGDLEKTREVCRDGIRMAGEIGHRNAEAGFWTTLGEVERFDGRWDEARRCYGEAERLDTICGSKHAYLVRFNRLLAEVGAGEYEDARRQMEALEPALERIGMVGWLSASIELVKAACAAGLGEWDAALGHARAAAEALAEFPMIERDIAWLAEHVGRRAAEAGRRDVAAPMLEMAADQWRELEDEGALERIGAY
ncbi:MAG: serine/threonine-protein kinase PknK [Myxococcota bacterium]